MPPEILRHLLSRRQENTLDAKHTMNNLNTIFIVEKVNEGFFLAYRKENWL